MKAGLSSLKSGSNMGYYTYYYLEMYGDQDKIDDAFDDAMDSEDERIRELVGDNHTDIKWYDFEKDFKKFAKRHPDVLFVVQGDGEESYDLWEERFKGDISEYHEVIMPPFTTPELLTDSEKQKLSNN